jgi:hypothetical protein
MDVLNLGCERGSLNTDPPKKNALKFTRLKTDKELSMSSSTRSSLVGGALLILLGLFFLAGQVLEIPVLDFTWPLIIIGIGGLFFVAMLLGGKNLGALAIPGSIISGIGLILFAQNALNIWESWSYSWALIIVFVGIGIFIYGAFSGLPEQRKAGLNVMRIGMILFIVFGAFFGLLFTLTGVYGLGNGLVWAILLMVLGAYMFISRVFRWARRSEEAGENPVRFFWPILFMGVGALWLLVAMNILPSEQALALLNLWPILLIVGGIDLMVGRRFPVINLILGLLTVAALFFFAFAGPAVGLDRLSLFRLNWINFDDGIPSQRITGSGNTAIEGREISGFDRIKVRSIGEVEIIQGDNDGVVIEADDNLLPYITTRVLAGELVIETKPGFGLHPKSDILYTITVKNLEEVESSGAARVNIKDLKTTNLSLSSSGAGEFLLTDLEANSLEIKISGAGSFQADGVCEELDVNISGAGNFDGPDLKVERAKVRISGLGNATLWVTEKLETRISGMGNIKYYGNPSIDQTNSGAGITQPMGEK